MANSAMTDYWQEAVAQALEEAGAPALADEQLKEVAASMEIASEQVGMAFGYDAIPDPRAREMKQADEKHAKELSKLERDYEIMRDALASQIGVEPRAIYLNHGVIEVVRR